MWRWLVVMMMLAAGSARADWWVYLMNGTSQAVDFTISPNNGGNGVSGHLDPGQSSGPQSSPAKLTTVGCTTVSVIWADGHTESRNVCWYTGEAAEPNFDFHDAAFYGARLANWYNPLPAQGTRKWTHSVVNTGVLAETYRLKLDFATGDDVERELTVLPGATLNLNVEDFRDFTVTLERMQPLPDKMGMGWVAESGIPSVTAGTQGAGWTPPPPTAQAGPGNVWTDGNRGGLGTMPDIAVPPQTRSTDYSDTTKAVKTGDDNAQARHAELSALLVASDRRATERANVELATLGAGLERVRQAVIAEGEANRAAVTNLDGHLTGDGAAKTLPIGIEGEDLTAGADEFAGWWVPPSVGKTAPQVTLPLSLASDQLTDATLDLGDSRAAGWVATVRGFVLLAVSGGFLMASFQLVGRAAGV